MRFSLLVIAFWFACSSAGNAQADFFEAFGWPTAADNASISGVPDSVSIPKETPTRRILPEDIVQASIQLWRFSTNKFAVKWTYTEAGASRMLAFRENHERQRVRTVVGSYETPLHEYKFVPMPPTFTNYAQWKEGWLKHPTDKFYGVSEENAKKIVAGLKSL